MENETAFDYFSKLGASVNAFTTYDLTCYEVFSSTYFKENLNYLLDYVQTPYFTKELVNNERGIIKEEINMYKNNPSTELTYASYKNIFVKDNRKNLISGEIEDIKKITVENLYDCYNTFYNPSNMFIIITGKVNPYEALAIIEENQLKKEYKNRLKNSRMDNYIEREKLQQVNLTNSSKEYCTNCGAVLIGPYCMSCGKRK
jgi:predicted Zn-dependent peptidase